MKTLAFNTGRTYTPNGQRLACALLDTGAIVFNDIDRGIFGTIYTPGLTLEEVLTMGFFRQAPIMADYDANQYTETHNPELREELRALAESI
jgi:hypothetical protein